jgi:hypothetical protein
MKTPLPYLKPKPNKETLLKEKLLSAFERSVRAQENHAKAMMLIATSLSGLTLAFTSAAHEVKRNAKR